MEEEKNPSNPESTKTPAPSSDSNIVDNLSTETIVELKTSDGWCKNILGLLNMGAISSFGAFIKRDALASIPHTIEQVNGRIQGRYASKKANEVA
eukprot:8093301-Ditylum_brightwellii.AAC.1